MILPIAIALSALVFLPGISEPVTTPKAVWLAGIALFAVATRWTSAMRFPHWPLFGGFLLWDLLSIFLASDIEAWLWGFSSDFLGIVFFYHALNFGSKKEVEVFSKAVVIVSLLLYSFYCLSLLFPAYSVYLGHQYIVMMTRQVFIFQLVVIPLALLTVWTAGWPWIFLGIFTAVGAVAYIVGTGSITGVIYLVFILLFFLLMLASILKALPSLCCVLGILFAFVLFSLPVSDWNILKKEANRKLEGRVEMWRGAITLSKFNFGLGVGRGNYYVQAQPIVKFPYTMTEEVREAHNDFLQMAAELGLIGGVLFLAVVIVALYPNRQIPLVFLAQYAIVISAIIWFPFQRHLFSVLFFYLGGLRWVVEKEEL